MSPGQFKTRLQPRKLTGEVKTCKSDLFAFNGMEQMHWKTTTLSLPWKNMQVNLLRSAQSHVPTSTDKSLALQHL